MSKVCPKNCQDYGKCYECPVVHHAGDLKIDNIDKLLDELIKEKEAEK